MNDKSEIQHLPAPANTRDQLSKSSQDLIARGRQDLVKALAPDRYERDSCDEGVYEKLSRTERDAVLKEVGNYIQRGDNLTSEELFARGVTYFSGDGVPQDYEEAIVWFRRAAERYNVKAIVYLGGMYDMGWGVPADISEAASWYTKAAELGSAHAQYKAAMIYMYELPRNVKNDDRGTMWLLKSAEQGYAEAQMWLGELYLKTTKSGARDYKEAYFWSYLAHELYTTDNRTLVAGSTARNRDKAATFLTDAELAQTQDRVKKWLEERATRPVEFWP